MATVVVLNGAELPQPVSVPHLAWPFTITADGAVCVQQDSVEEIGACVTAICSWVLGQRQDSPTFGIPSPVFSTIPLNTNGIRAAITALEPRAQLAITETGGSTDPSSRTIVIDVSPATGV